MCSKSTIRRDLFVYIRYTMYCAHMQYFHLEQHFPVFLRGLGFLLELLWEFFLYFVTFHIMILYICTIYLNYHDGDLELFVNCLIQTIIYWWTITMKLYFKRFRNKDLQDLFNLLNFNHKTRSALGFTYVTMDRSWAMSNKWSKLYINACFMGTLFWLCLPIAYGDRSLPLSCWYPFDYKKPFVYETIYFLQFVGQIQVAAAFSASSGFYMALLISIAGQYDILNCSLKNILATVALNSNATRTQLKKLHKLQEFSAPEINEFYCSKEISCRISSLLLHKRNTKNPCFRIQFRNAIKECVDHHRYILKCLNKIEDFYCPIWFFKMGQVISLACLVAFVSVKSTASHSTYMKIFSLAQYMLLITWELLIICYFGEIIFWKSLRCGEAILRCPWYLHLREMRLDFLIFVLNSKKPFQLTAGKILALNTELFKSMITTTFSFLTLLQKLDKRNV